MSNREKAYTEVYTILQDLEDEELKKIPYIVLRTIKNSMDEEYQYELDENLELEYQPMLPETKAILFNLFRDYLATEEQKQKIIRMQNEERQKLENAKREKYNTDVFENFKTINERIQYPNSLENVKINNYIQKQNENVYLAKKEENILKNFFNKIKFLFKKIKSKF